MSPTRLALLCAFYRWLAHTPVEDCHANRDPGLDLLEHAALGAIGDVVGDFDAAIHRAWMQHDCVGLGQRQACLVEAEEARILDDAGEEDAAEALVLDA